MADKKIKTKLGPASHAREFKCPAHDTGEEDVILLFASAPDGNKHDVVKLDRAGLPASYQGKPVEWIANFGIVEKEHGQYVDMTYTVIVTPRPGQTLVCYNSAKNQFHPIQVRPAPAEYPGKLAFDLTIGDPGSGWVR